MKIYALADLHLSISCPDKDMKVFAPEWDGYHEKIADHWQSTVHDDDLVVIAGDITWAMRAEEAVIDLEWIDKLPGTKVMIRGNHDYWWQSLSKIKKILPPSIHAVQHTAFNFGDVSVSGTRLWDSPDFHCGELIVMRENTRENKDKPKSDTAKIYERELGRLQLAVDALDKSAKLKIIMVHYPPLSPDMTSTRASDIIEKGGADLCIFGHLHSLKPDIKPFGEARGVNYLLTSADYLDFTPQLVAEV